MSAVAVKLSSLDRLLAGIVGLSRNGSARKNGWSLEAGRTDLGIERDIIGAIGELAVARYTGRHWEPIIDALDTDRGDVAEFQVKSVTTSHGNLLVRDHDPEHTSYVLCEVQFTQVLLLGWAHGTVVKQPEWWRTAGMHRPCYAYPRDKLRSMDELLT